MTQNYLPEYFLTQGFLYVEIYLFISLKMVDFDQGCIWVGNKYCSHLNAHPDEALNEGSSFLMRERP